VSVSLSLVDVASAEQTAVSHSALMKIVSFDESDNIEVAEHYLLATALSTHPTEATLGHLLVSLFMFLLIYLFYRLFLLVSVFRDFCSFYFC